TDLRAIWWPTEEFPNQSSFFITGGKNMKKLKTNPLAKTIKEVETSLKSIKKIMTQKEKFKLKIPNPRNPNIHVEKLEKCRNRTFRKIEKCM
ncbi:hypothetical protein L9F63_008880, partial [Diploptera punctata]